jgi:hypothetical protein
MKPQLLFIRSLIRGAESIGTVNRLKHKSKNFVAKIRSFATLFGHESSKHITSQKLFAKVFSFAI